MMFARASRFLPILLVSIGFHLFVPQGGVDAAVPFTINLDAPDSVIRGGAVQLTPTAFGGTYPYSCSLRNDTQGRILKEFTIQSSTSSFPSYSENIQSNQTYSLGCTDAAGIFKKDTAVVTVNDQGKSNLSVSVFSSPESIPPGGQATINYYVSQGIFPYQCEYSDSSGSRKSMTITSSTPGVDGDNFTSSEEVSPASTTTYSLSCKDATGTSKQRDAILNVTTTPVITLTGDPLLLPENGGSVTLSWKTDNLVTSCKRTGGNAEWQANTSKFDGTLAFNLTSSTTFFLECFSSGGASSGKKSVTFSVGSSALCGNGVWDKDSGEECDDGPDNSDTCPSQCTASCQEKYCSNSSVIFEGSFDGASGDIEDCGYGGLRIKPGATVTYTWNAKNAKTCSRSYDDRLDAPFRNCFPEANPDGGPVSIPVKGTCPVTVPADADPDVGYGFEIFCTDGAAGEIGRGSFYGARLRDGDIICTAPPADDVDMHIASFTANPSTVPFGYTGDVVFSWESVVEPAGGATPTCNFYYESGAKKLEFSGLKKSVALLPSQLTRNANAGPPGTKMASLYCYLPDDTKKDDDKVVYIYFQSDPNVAPVVALAFGSSDNKSKAVTVVAGKPTNVFLQTGGAERCEYTITGSTPYAQTFVPMKAGEKKMNHTFTGNATITLECFNGTLSAKDVITVSTGGPNDNGGGGGGWGGDGTCQAPNTCVSGGCTPDKYKPGSGTCGDTGLSCCTPLALPSPGVGYFNPLKYNSLDSVLTAVLSTLQSIVVVLSIIMIIVGAVMYILSAGNESRVSQAKVAITASVVGLALAIAAPAFLKEIGELLGWIEVTQVVEEAQTFTEIASKVLSFLLSIVGIIAIIMLVIGGLMYLTAGGDEGKAETGKKITKYAIIAIAIALAALVMVTQVAKFFG